MQTFILNLDTINFQNLYKLGDIDPQRLSSSTFIEVISKQYTFVIIISKSSTLDYDVFANGR